MPLFNIFKKEKPEERKEKKEKEKVEPIEELKNAKEEKPRKIKEKKTGIAYRILKAPQITEKSTTLAEKNQYVFKVFPNTNKIEIKTAIEDLYNVDVLSVRIIKVRPKKRRLGRISGWRAGYKKAVVKIKAGQKIEVMPR